MEADPVFFDIVGDSASVFFEVGRALELRRRSVAPFQLLDALGELADDLVCAGQGDMLSSQGLLGLTPQGIEVSVVPVRSVNSEVRRLLRQYECNFGGKALPMGSEEVVGGTRRRGALAEDRMDDIIRRGCWDGDLGRVDDFGSESELGLRGVGGH